ncbi:MAG: hypothetical protein WEG40_08555 [Candidatus Rokuibacteriota bacterium]
MRPEQGGPPPGGGSPPEGGEARGKGFKARKREDHALVLIRELLGDLGNLPRARQVLRELSRYYDPVLGGAIVEVRHQREIMEALEAGRAGDAEALIRVRYELYVKDRAHLGRGDEG